MATRQSPALWGASGHRFWVMQEGKDIWVEESATKPAQSSERGKPSRAILHSAASRSEAEELAKRATTGTGYTLRSAAK